MARPAGQHRRHLFIDLTSAVIGAAAGYLSLWLVFQVFRLITGREGMGYGDFKLLAVFGAFLGWQMLPLVILLSSLIGAIVGIGLIVLRGRDRQIPIPFGPYLRPPVSSPCCGVNRSTRSYLHRASACADDRTDRWHRQRKTVASDEFARLGAEVIDYRPAQSLLVEPGQPALTEIVALFGPIGTRRHRAPRPRALREKVLPTRRRAELEGILHPKIRGRCSKRAAQSTALTSYS